MTTIGTCTTDLRVDLLSRDALDAFALVTGANKVKLAQLWLDEDTRQYLDGIAAEDTSLLPSTLINRAQSAEWASRRAKRTRSGS